MLKYSILHSVFPSFLPNTLPSLSSNDLSHHHSTTRVDYALFITFGNYLTMVSLLVMTISILVSYVFTEHFSLGVQIMAHISTIISAAIAKIAYVIRCIGAHGLGHKAF
ncbi:hypothetical protein WNY51_06890 [Pseudocolwellia sp. AS88]|uniref:hypothetical protein n=1 Tax=Pseudocolwellia sp. AS88 TaxID=3063958 RepID=UPI0026EE2345|nr:hypothetical protein [Pseudocolwellia sp. AS88]MDO7086069.1 hypothetical protein [Pseudocolwellia sp. AS88]